MAAKLKREIEDKYTRDEMKVGCRWTIVYEFAGVILVLIALNGVVMVIGSWSWYARLGSSCCFCLLGILNLVSIIVTAVFRFNLFGQLAAISHAPSKYSSGPFKIDKQTM